MKKITKLAAGALILSLIFGCTACSKKDQGNTTSPSAVTPTVSTSVTASVDASPTQNSTVSSVETSVPQSAEPVSVIDSLEPASAETSVDASAETSADTSTQAPASADAENSTSSSGTPTEPTVYVPEFITSLPIPAAFVAENSEKKGTVETITYETKVYDLEGQGSVTVEKKADVYLPYGYDPDGGKSYNVLYLMHGGGETYTYWLTENKKTVNMLDNMFAEGKAEPCIVVAPTFYTNAPGSTGGSATSTLATDVFRWEFRNDLVPAVESHYATYSKSDVTEAGLIATRDHRGFAGLSMGSMVSIRSIIIGCLDICAYINSMSGGYDADQNNTQAGFDLIKDAMMNTFKKYRVKYWLNHNGARDMALAPHVQLNQMIMEDPDLTKRLKEDKNYKFIEFPTGSHSYDSWIAGAYNCLLVFFR